jgi:hypothetical protein
MAYNFIETVRAAGPGENHVRVVKVANADEIGNAQEVAALPTPAETWRNVLFRLTTDNLIYYLNDAGTGWVALDRGSPTEVISVDGLTGEVKINTRAIVTGEIINAHRMVRVGPDGKGYYASSADITHAPAMLGLSLTAGILGATVTVAAEGAEITEGSWTWTPGARLYLNGTSGQISTTSPSSGYSRQIGVALTATSMRVNFGEIIAVTGSWAPSPTPEHTHDANAIVSGTLDGDRLPDLSADKNGGVPATGTPSGLFLKDDGTFAAAGGGFSPIYDITLPTHADIDDNSSEYIAIKTLTGLDTSKKTLVRFSGVFYPDYVSDASIALSLRFFSASDVAVDVGAYAGVLTYAVTAAGDGSASLCNAFNTNSYSGKVVVKDFGVVTDNQVGFSLIMGWEKATTGPAKVVLCIERASGRLRAQGVNVQEAIVIQQ